MRVASSKFCSAATLFVVDDVLESIAYYCDVVGFKMVFTYGEPVFYGGVERDDVTVHLQASHQTSRHEGQGAVNVFVTEVDALYDELRSRGALVLQPPDDRSYGMRDFDIDDLDGNRLTFGMAIDAAA